MWILASITDQATRRAPLTRHPSGPTPGRVECFVRLGRAGEGREKAGEGYGELEKAREGWDRLGTTGQGWGMLEENLRRLEKTGED